MNFFSWNSLVFKKLSKRKINDIPVGAKYQSLTSPKIVWKIKKLKEDAQRYKVVYAFGSLLLKMLGNFFDRKI